ncbi:peptidase inhibitor family I36 protein [Streptomyces sp. NPDC052109]|uniref:peptidase inhibitor family I36 protein n=1 Tax=Streptomyces sp. NPDC052109 TaxID=3155527 RepID=UPI00341BBD95
MHIRKSAALVVAAAAIATGASVVPAAAQNDGRCTTSVSSNLFGELCLYYNSGLSGSHADFNVPTKDEAGYVFSSSGAGQGQPVKNNAASATNLDPDCTAIIFYNSGWSGPADYIDAHSSVSRLNKTYNNNASNHWECP